MSHRLFFFVLILFFSACTTRSPRFFPENVDFENPTATAALLDTLNQNSSEIRSFRALFDLELKRKGKKNKFLATQIFERPESSRITFLFPGINQLALLLIANKGELFVKDNSAKKSYQVEASAEQLEKYLFVPLELEELMLWSTGESYLPLQRISAQHVRRGDLSYLKIIGTDQKEQMFVVKHLVDQQVRIENFRIDRDGRMLFVAKYFYADEKNSLPVKIDFSLTSQSVDGVITYKKQDLNPDLSSMREQLFKID